jgi:hypothetical protein
MSQGVNIAILTGRLASIGQLKQSSRTGKTISFVTGTIGIERPTARGQEPKTDFLFFRAFSTAATYLVGQSEDGFKWCPVGSLINIVGSHNIERNQRDEEYHVITVNNVTCLWRFSRNDLPREDDNNEESDFDGQTSELEDTSGVVPPNDNEPAKTATGLRGRRQSKGPAPTDDELNKVLVEA